MGKHGIWVIIKSMQEFFGRHSKKAFLICDGVIAEDLGMLV